MTPFCNFACTLHSAKRIRIPAIWINNIEIIYEPQQTSEQMRFNKFKCPSLELNSPYKSPHEAVHRNRNQSRSLSGGHERMPHASRQFTEKCTTIRLNANELWGITYRCDFSYISLALRRSRLTHHNQNVLSLHAANKYKSIYRTHVA